MQRTVNSTIVTYAETTLNPDGTPNTELKTVEVDETAPKAVLKSAIKSVGHYIQPLKLEIRKRVFVLDDEIFFKYAKEVIAE